jgi:hypothetical protein
LILEKNEGIVIEYGKEVSDFFEQKSKKKSRQRDDVMQDQAKN